MENELRMPPKVRVENVSQDNNQNMIDKINRAMKD